jgi:UDP-N-acetylmuramate--alanine ligase
MSGIAEVMATLGYKVQGSDLTDNYNTARLRKNGIGVSIGHDAANLGEAQVVVVSSAVKPENPRARRGAPAFPADRAPR